MGEIKIPVVSIDTGVPIPENDRLEYPLSQLEVGESFVFPVDKRPSVQSKASKMKRDTGREFVVRKQSPELCRIWRKS